MKKVAIFLLTVIIFAGCTNKSVGIIGGSDGPTVILVAEEERNTTIESIRMINVDGSLYYDSGLVSDLVPRCGTLDGELKKTAGEFEIPLNGSECNFEASGYQSATSITKEVPIGNDWVIFKKIVDDEKDFSVYKYCFYLTGTFTNAVRESELIVLSKDKDITFEKVEKSMFSSQSEDHLDIYVIPVIESDKWGVQLMAKDVTSTSLTLVIEQFGGHPTGEVQTGSWYKLERLNDGTWEEIGYLPREVNVVWTSEAYILRKNERAEFIVDWEWLYGELEEGMYRIGKRVSDFRGTGDFTEDIYYAEFYVGE